jgi:nitroimidazol reductase NimA-like FMN-containing flavoprotein (pyridoxamine 5'-phosphate oxidase superfamily)
MSDETPSARSTVRRLPERASYEREVIEAILDEGLVCHVGFAVDGQPYVLPMVYGRDGDTLFLHGSSASRLIRGLAEGIPVCVTVTLLDGLVLARSAFHHSMNYRSVVVLGTARLVEDAGERLTALRTIVEHVVPGRWDEARRPNVKELAQTFVLALPIEEATAKRRSGPPADDEEDYALDVWAGELPLPAVPGPPLPDPRLRAGIAVPPTVSAYRRSGPR